MFSDVNNENAKLCRPCKPNPCILRVGCFIRKTIYFQSDSIHAAVDNFSSNFIVPDCLFFNKIKWPQRKVNSLPPKTEVMPPVIDVDSQFQFMIDLARERTLTLDEKLQLERLLFQLWRDKLKLPHASIAILMKTMVSHDEATQMNSTIMRLLYSKSYPILLPPIDLIPSRDAAL